MLLNTVDSKIKNPAKAGFFCVKRAINEPYLSLLAYISCIVIFVKDIFIPLYLFIICQSFVLSFFHMMFHAYMYSNNRENHMFINHKEKNCTTDGIEKR